MYNTHSMAEQQSGPKNAAQIRGKNDSSKDKGMRNNQNLPDGTAATSLSTHVLWNISKALEKDPTMHLKDAITAAQARLEIGRDVSAMFPDSAGQRHLACALLAWQQMGHSSADSLCQFVSSKAQECIATPSNDTNLDKTSKESLQVSKYSKDVLSMSFGSNTIGPVVKLPVDTKIVMRMENSTSARQCKKPKASDKNTMNKIEAACCLDSACAARLAKMDTATTELRMRAGTLAKREAERVELLERAEAAWKDLELGYQRRLSLAEEKEEDLSRQIQKAIEDRNVNKNACTTLASQLREKGDKAEKDRTSLSLAEKEVCERACLRLKLSEESAQGDAVLTEHQCRAAQLERDLLFKEEQARRKLLNFQSELESSQTITHETERAMRAELSALREQIGQVSEQLLGEDADSARIKEELEDLRQEKMGMVEDLEGCKMACDSRMQGKIDELKKKRDQLGELKDKVMECRCKLPVDVVVEVKRTASLAALCRCSPEEKILESCSCTSLRSSLLSNLLGDLFSGLQSEMGGTGTQMPCQLLKCLEDKHNWDRASIVKSNLKNYFSQLLIGELDIAIANSIEKYHAKWVGQSCADTSRMVPDPGEEENEGWQERAIERRAQKLATKLAEQLFQERADQLTQRAKDIVSSGPPPCECKPASPPQNTKQHQQNTNSMCCKEASAVYPVLISGKSIPPLPMIGPTTPANTPAYWRQTMQDVTQLRVQIEDLKKDTIKKEDLKLMEEKITKIVQRGSESGKTDCHNDSVVYSNAANDIVIRKEQKINKAMSSNQPSFNVNPGKPTHKKKLIEMNNSNKKGQKHNIPPNTPDKTYKPYKKLGQTYAVNMCMCSQKDPNKVTQQNKLLDDSVFVDGKGKDKTSRDSIPQLTSSIKQTKPINSSIHSRDMSTRTNSKSSGQQSCLSNCNCFHKIPSNTSIDKLLETLAKWKSDLNSCEKEMPCCNFLPGKEISELNDKKRTQNDSNKSIDASLKGKQVPDIKEESVDKVSSRSRPSVDKQMKSNQSSFSDQKSLMISKTHSELDKEKKHIISKKSIGDTGSNSYKGTKGVSCNNSTDLNNMQSSPYAPTTTESEYMGAINLDKSNEDFCKCVKGNEVTLDPLKCMPCKCSCKSLDTEKDTKKHGEVLVSEIETHKSNKKIGRAREKNDTATLKKSSSKCNENKPRQPEVFPCDCGYDIQFLGVTLTDVNRNDSEVNEVVCGACNLGTNKTSDANKKCRSNNESIDKKVSNQGNNNKVSEKHQSVRDMKRTSRDSARNNEANNINSSKQNSICCDQEIRNENKTNEISDENKREKCNKCQLFKRKVIKEEVIQPCDSTPCCECKENFDDFKEYINIAFQNQQSNEDKSLDVQSFKESKAVEEPCVCCNKQKSDESEDLEQNTFILLEEHLKKKLDEFKETSCNSTCIPPDEEEKLFTTILTRVKQIIAESTNKIACKCADEEKTSAGSWNRAYGLLQEYLKTKIKRVQCSCETKANNDAVLPEVLDKVCNLIENDFKRLQDVCGCKKSDVQDYKQVNFKDELPERDNDISYMKKKETSKNINDCCSQNPQTLNVTKENNSSQVPAYLGMETKSCNPLETHAKKVQTNENIQDNLATNDNMADCICDGKNVDADLLEKNELNQSESAENGYKNKPALYSNASYVAYAECVCRDTECVKKIEPDTNNDVIVNDILKKPTCGELESGKLKSILNNKPISNNIQKQLDDTEVSIENINDNSETSNKTNICCVTGVKKFELLSTNEKSTIQTSDPVPNECACNSKNCCGNTNTKSENFIPFTNKPYLGYTLNCSCDGALGACVCTKSIFQADNGVMDNIMTKSLRNDKYSYIMKSHPTDNINYHNDLLPEMTGDLYLHNVLKHKTLYDSDTKQDGETEVSFYDDEDIVLKNSREYYEMAHTTTNTFDDNMSLDTDYSTPDAPLDWCECCSQLPSRQLNSDQLKQSIYFPVPLESENPIDMKGTTSKSLSKVVPKCCDCDLVPICHVKMLVENIENKLVSANCTCDSMIPKVCPIHSNEV